MVLGLLAIAAIPSTIGTCQGISQQKRLAAEAKRTAKFNLVCSFPRKGKGPSVDDVFVILKDGKVRARAILTSHRSRIPPI